MSEGRFCTVINCMDGRVQEPVIHWVKVRYGVDYADMITEPGPVRLISEQDSAALESIRKRVTVSVEKHGSRLLVVAGHHDCAGNPVPRDRQTEQIIRSIEIIRKWSFPVSLVGIYLSEGWHVNIVQEDLSQP